MQKTEKYMLFIGLAVRIAETIFAMRKTRNLNFVPIAVRLWIGVIENVHNGSVKKSDT